MSESEKRIPPFGLRLPPKLKERVQDAARANHRSMNAEIVDRLDLSFIHEIEGREADNRSLRNEVMEMRRNLLHLTFTLLNNDKEGFKEIIQGVLSDYRAEIEAVEREGEEAREKWLANKNLSAPVDEE